MKTVIERPSLLAFLKARIRAYTKTDGTVVRAHERKDRPRSATRMSSGQPATTAPSGSDREREKTVRLYGGQEAWARAKAAGRTTLTSHQWAQVRTPAFKAWFGEWELAALDKTMRRVRGSAHAKKAEIVGKPLVNVETGLTATVSGESFGKMMSRSAVSLSVSSQAHMQALGNLDVLFPLATRQQTRAGKKATDERSIDAVHRFTVPMPFDGQVLAVNILAKQFIDERHGTRLYLVEAVEIVTPASLETGETRLVEGGSAGSPAVPPRPAGVADRFAQMVAAVKGEGGSLSTQFRNVLFLPK